MVDPGAGGAPDAGTERPNRSQAGLGPPLAGERPERPRLCPRAGRDTLDLVLLACAPGRWRHTPDAAATEASIRATCVAGAGAGRDERWRGGPERRGDPLGERRSCPRHGERFRRDPASGGGGPADAMLT